MDILICDDEPLAVERLSRLVSQLGHDVVATASHGRQAIDLAHQYEPDVILLDIQMPEMNGLACAQHLRQLDPMPAIVFCTAYDQHALDAFKSNAEGYLLKPVMQQELAQVLEHLTKLTQAQMSQLKQKKIWTKSISAASRLRQRPIVVSNWCQLKISIIFWRIRNMSLCVIKTAVY